jgi:hypothetical protein
VILLFLQSLTWCDQFPYILAYIVILCLIYIFITPIFFFRYHLQDNRHQNIMRISCVYPISYIMICIFITIVFIMVYNNNAVIIQQGDKVYQCVRTYELTLQAYPLILDLNSSVIKDYRDHSYSCDLLSYGPIFPYGQTLEASPNYLKYSHGSRFLDAFACKQNDLEGVNLCHRYGSVSFDWKFLWSLICNCTLGNGEDAGMTVTIRCLWMRYIWATVPKGDVTPHHEGNFTIY